MKKNILRIVFLILIIINSLIIFGFSSQNGEESGNLSKSIITKIADILNIEDNRENFIDVGEKVIRKLAHFGIYTLLGIWSIGFLLTFNIKLKYQVVIASIWGCIYALTDEFHQSFSFGRHASINDVVIDTLGVIFGLLLVLLVLKIKKKKKKASPMSNKKINS